MELYEEDMVWMWKSYGCFCSGLIKDIFFSGVGVEELGLFRSGVMKRIWWGRDVQEPGLHLQQGQT
jgi:hypothetical protein